MRRFHPFLAAPLILAACISDATPPPPGDAGPDAACASPKKVCTSGSQTTCTDTSSDNGNCGACNNACPTGTTCSASQCVCTDTTKTNCSGVCVNLSSDPKNCGACGVACINANCTAGECDRVVFVTGATYFPNLTNGADPFTPADTDCNGAAKSAKLPGTYMAWIATQNSSPSVRFTTKSKTPYVLPDGSTRVANDWGDLTKGSLQHAIDQTEVGTPIQSSDDTRRVMTNVAANGTSASASLDCTEWTTVNTTIPIVGDCTATTGDWTNVATNPAGWNCSVQYRLYCFEQ